MLHSEFKTKWLGKGFAENKEYGYQCVAGAKIYAKEVFGLQLKSFGGSAYNGFVTGSPFVGLPFVKLLNTPDFIPKVGDIVFFDKDKTNLGYGHVGIVDEGTTVKTLKVLNQNMKTGTGHGKGDEFSISTFNYLKPKCLGVYRYVKK